MIEPSWFSRCAPVFRWRQASEPPVASDSSVGLDAISASSCRASFTSFSMSETMDLWRSAFSAFIRLDSDKGSRLGPSPNPGRVGACIRGLGVYWPGARPAGPASSTNAATPLHHHPILECMRALRSHQSGFTVSFIFSFISFARNSITAASRSMTLLAARRLAAGALHLLFY